MFKAYMTEVKNQLDKKIKDPTKENMNHSGFQIKNT